MMKILARAALVLGTIVAPIAATAVTADAAPMERDHRVTQYNGEQDRGIESRGIESRGIESRGIESRGTEYRGTEYRNEQPAPFKGQYDRGYKFQSRRALAQLRQERNRERAVMLRAEQARNCERKF